MSQAYHSNARTNQHIREIIQKSNLTNVELAKNYNLNVKTISKWKHRNFIEDKSSRPHNIKTTANSKNKCNFFEVSSKRGLIDNLLILFD